MVDLFCKVLILKGWVPIMSRGWFYLPSSKRSWLITECGFRVFLLVGVFEGEVDLVVAVGGGVLVGGVAEAVLCAELGSDLRVYLVYSLLFGDLEEATSGLRGHAFEDFFAVGALSAATRATLASSATTSRIASAASTWVTSAAAGIATAAGVAAATSGVAAAASASAARWPGLLLDWRSSPLK